jgi:N-acetylmuramoyl-L-alanine amidase
MTDKKSDGKSVSAPRLWSVGGDAKNASDMVRQMEIDTMARTLWGEARGEGNIGMQAVANVIVNRVEYAKSQNGFWWGDTILKVCHKPYQFSCWNKNDPNYRKLLEIDDSNHHFALALRLANRAVLGFLPDITYQSTHYHERSILPHWARRQKPKTVIGRHIFYRLLD